MFIYIISSQNIGYELTLFRLKVFRNSEKCFVKQGNISLQILLNLFINPSFEVNEVESLRVFNFLLFQPLSEKWEMIQNFLSVEYSINHVATEKSHFYLVS